MACIVYQRLREVERHEGTQAYTHAGTQARRHDDAAAPSEKRGQGEEWDRAVADAVGRALTSRSSLVSFFLRRSSVLAAGSEDEFRWAPFRAETMRCSFDFAAVFGLLNSRFLSAVRFSRSFLLASFLLAFFSRFSRSAAACSIELSITQSVTVLVCFAGGHWARCISPSFGTEASGSKSRGARSGDVHGGRLSLRWMCGRSFCGCLPLAFIRGNRFFKSGSPGHAGSNVP